MRYVPSPVFRSIFFPSTPLCSPISSVHSHWLLNIYWYTRSTGILASPKALFSRPRACFPSSDSTSNVSKASPCSYYTPIEYIFFFTAPWALLLTGRIGERLEVGAGTWSVRAWEVYTLLMVGLFGVEWVELGLTKEGEKEGKEEELGKERTSRLPVHGESDHVPYDPSLLWSSPSFPQVLILVTKSCAGLR